MQTADCEVFRDLIPVEALNKEENLQRRRGRHGILPGFRLDLPGPGAGPGALGQVESKLAELKVIGAVETYYPRGRERARAKKGVEMRAGLIPGEYRRPLAALDTRYHRVEEGQRGPLVRRLEGYGHLLTWVMGAWQEGSKDLHGLLDVLADPATLYAPPAVSLLLPFHQSCPVPLHSATFQTSPFFPNFFHHGIHFLLEIHLLSPLSRVSGRSENGLKTFGRSLRYMRI